MERYGSVYVLRVKGLVCYVGQTVRSVQVRWRNHVATAMAQPKMKVSKAIAEIGVSSFCAEEVFVAFSKEALDWAERTLIASFSPLYNTAVGGAGMPGVKPRPEKVVAFLAAVDASRQDPIKREAWISKMKEYGRTPEAVARGKALQKHPNYKSRWLGHTKKVAERKDRGAVVKAMWQDPETRQKILDGQARALAKPEVRARRAAASTGRKMPPASVEATRRAKFRPLYCPELACTFLSHMHAAAFFGVHRCTVGKGAKSGKKVRGITLREVRHEL
jgi:hypothetical protein